MRKKIMSHTFIWAYLFQSREAIFETLQFKIGKCVNILLTNNNDD